MRCKNCPAYWEDRDYYYGPQDWGCYCDSKSGSDQGREFANGDIGCNRKLPYIQKVMKEVEKQKKIEEAYIDNANEENRHQAINAVWPDNEEE